VLSSSANESITLAAKGSGGVQLNTANVGYLQKNGVANIAWSGVSVRFETTATATASTVRFSYIGAADTSLTASAEAPSTYFNIGQTRQHATGALTLQRDFRITGSTHSFVGASTLTDAAAFSVDGPCIAGTNATITNSHGIYVPTRALTGTITNAFGLSVAAPSGATNNYAAYFNGTLYQNGNIELGHASDTTISRVSAGVVAVEGVNLAKITDVDKTLPFDAAAMIPRTTNGCGVNSTETGIINYDSMDFDSTTAEYAQVWCYLPANYTTSATVTAKFSWTADSGSGGVVWACAARCFSDDAALNQAQGTAQQIADTFITAGDEHTTSSTPAITIAGSPAAGNRVCFEFSRLPADGSDTLAVDARLKSVEITYT
jgi:hypothetical protein